MIVVYLDIDTGRIARYDSMVRRLKIPGGREPPKRTHDGYSPTPGPEWDWKGLMGQMRHNPPAELRSL